MKDWQNKALFRHGQTVLGQETKEKIPDPNKQVEITPKVVFRSQMEARQSGKTENTGQKSENSGNGATIFADGVSYNAIRRQDVIEKAGDIIKSVQKPTDI